jgi:hypothetical protein
MEVAKKIQSFTEVEVSNLLTENYSNLMESFFELQSSYLTGIYKEFGNIETANILLHYIRNTHLQIIRQREKNLNFNVSLENFWKNFSDINLIDEKISSVVQMTAIPKETVRRKIKNLIDLGLLNKIVNSRGYVWSIPEIKKNHYYKIANQEVFLMTKFIVKFVKCLNLNLSSKIIENEIKSQYSFYWYHFLSCELEWLKMWQGKLKDNDLLLISLQTTIPTLHYVGKTGRIKFDDVFKLIGSINQKENLERCAVSATAISQVTGIPRATCIRKLERLVLLGFLIRQTKTKRYFVNQNLNDRTKNILHQKNVLFTIKIFSNYISIILNSLLHNQK